MNDQLESPAGDALSANAMDSVIRIAIVLLLAAWCFEIVKPFISPVVWGVIIAIAAQPIYAQLHAALGGRKVLTAAVLVLTALLFLIVPSVLLSGTLVDGARQLADALRDGAFQIPLPPDSVRNWPLVGEPIADFWNLASQNLSSALQQMKGQLKSLSLWLLAAAAGAGLGILQFVCAIGGFLSMGIVGLFVGSIVLVLGYTLLLAWLGNGKPPIPAIERNR